MSHNCKREIEAAHNPRISYEDYVCRIGRIASIFGKPRRMEFDGSQLEALDKKLLGMGYGVCLQEGEIKGPYSRLTRFYKRGNNDVVVLATYVVEDGGKELTTKTVGFVPRNLARDL